MPNYALSAIRHPLTALTVAALLAGCGGGGGDAATALSGTVAVGAPIDDGRVRVLDATGAVVASGIEVAADGSYTIPALTGTAPFRIEACGNVGLNWQCIYSVAQGPGTANVTPLTTAAVLLASGQTPEQVMAEGGSAPSAESLAGAQQQLRTGLAPVLDTSGVAPDLDFFAAGLEAGSRTGYDRVLDAVGVSTGVDGQPFVQITPRLGEGNLLLQQGSSTGAVEVDGAATGLSLSGLQTLFDNMSAAMVSAGACGDATTGLARSLAAGARMRMGDMEATGPVQVAQALCSMMTEQNMYPVHLLSPLLGRCDLGGAAPVCRISFVVGDGQGGTQSVGDGQGVTLEGGEWKFLGDVDPIELYARATVQRDRRVDGATPVDNYTRALQFEIAAADGLQCARVSQPTASGEARIVAYFKRFAGGGVERLSLWVASGAADAPSLDPASGVLRRADDTWVTLPEGGAGDTVVRNFLRAGRSVTIDLFGDAACTVPLQVAGRSSFQVDIQGVPPVWASLPGMPWPELTAAARQTLLDLPASSAVTLDAGWTFPVGPLGLRDASLCVDGMDCGEHGDGRIGDARLRPDAATARLDLRASGASFGAGRSFIFSLTGRNGEGLQVQANYQTCAGQAAGQACRE